MKYLSATVIVLTARVSPARATIEDMLAGALKRIEAVMLNRLLISSAFICLTICTAQADDRLVAAMKRIAELEAALDQSNKEKDALLKQQGIKRSSSANKTSLQTTLPSSPPSLSPSPATIRSDDNTPRALEGAYFGINGGYGGGDITSYTHFATQFGQFGTINSVGRLGGAIAGGQLGYNFLLGNNSVIGAETDFDWANVSTQGGASSQIVGAGTLGTSGSTYQVGINWIGTTRLRIGYQFGSFMPYLTGGLAYGMAVAQDTSNSSSTYSSSYVIQWHYANLSKISTGWSAGAGAEYTLDKNWSFKTDYLYTQVGTAPPNLTDFAYFPGSAPAVISGYGQNSPIGVHQVRAGLNYHPHFFEQPAPTIATKY